MSDRTDFVPDHGGDLVLPSDILFTRLLNVAHKPVSRAGVKDLNTGVSKTYSELLVDVVRLRRVIRSQLPPAVLKDLGEGKEVWINVLAPGGYEFSVAILAVLALGAAACMISVAHPVQEALYYVQKTRAVAVITATSALKLGQDLQKTVRASVNPDYAFVPVAAFERQPPPLLKDILISSNKYIDPNGAGVVIFTSGTTGPPKGAVLRRAAISDGALGFAETHRISETSVLLNLLPVHHATGLWVSFFAFILSGACIEFKSGSFDPRWTWDRWTQGGLTHFSGVPTIFMRMMRYYEEHLTRLPPTQVKAYAEAPLQFKIMFCGTSALPQPIEEFWTKMMNGRRIVQRYGATEIGVVFNMPFDDQAGIPYGSVGEPTLGVDVKLAPDPDGESKGDTEEGEILVRSYNMFAKYLHDPAATAAVHTPDGYFKTGDIARREGKYYFIVGRASIDIIKSGGYKIGALDIERELLALPYVGEVMIVGVPDDEFGQRVGAVLSLRTDQIALNFYQKMRRRPGTVTLDQLRDDARSRLAGYKLPTLLRIVEGELPKSHTGKVVKKILGPKYFPPDYARDPEVYKWDSKQAQKQLTPKL